MVAQKLKNNKITIGTVKRKDALETIENLKASEFCRLSKAAREWNESINDNRDLVFTHYENEHSKVCKEFDKILSRRKAFEEKLIQTRESMSLEQNNNTTNVETSSNVSEKSRINNKKPIIIWASKIKGTSRLLRIPKKQIIKIVRRKGLIDDNNRPNSVCISNHLREEFFADCKQSKHFQHTNLYEIMYSEEDSPEIYNKWDKKITEIYESGVNISSNDDKHNK